MSKLNSFRIINLNYNNNTMKIDDEHFDLGGQNTLMSLRNGGGKSVIVQMLIAPFVRKRYRNIKDREFKSYFTTNSPTYILTEWLLDDNKTNVLIGMMVKKKTHLTEEDDEEIDIINFIYEYSEEDKYSIINIPFVEKNEKSKIIKSFTNSKNLFEKLKKDINYNFNYYNMNMPNQSKNYFENLKEYNINHNEWESIIKEINKKESGLSELFNDCKTINNLVEKWFIKAVEDKLNQDDDRIKKFQNLVKKYIEQYKENKYKLSKKASIEKFEEMSKKILSCADDFKREIDNTSNIENKIANLIDYINNCIVYEEESLNNVDEKIKEIETFIRDLEYEKLSLDLYKSKEEDDAILKQEEEINFNIKTLEENISKENRNIHIMDCANLHEKYQQSSQERQEIENEIEVKKLKEKDLQPERQNCGYTLNIYYSNFEKQVNDKMKNNTQHLEDTKYKIDLLNKNIEDYNNKLQNKNIEKGSIETEIKHFNKDEEKFNKEYKKSFCRNIMNIYEEDFLTNEDLKYKEGIENLRKHKESKITKEINIKRNIDIENKREKEILLNERDLQYKKVEFEKSLDVANKNIEKRETILKYIDSSKDYLFDDEYIISMLNKKLEVVESNKQNLEINIKEINDEINKLKSGKNIELSDEIETKLKNRGINFVYGMEWLKSNNKSEEENIDLVKTNPLLPFSLIINKLGIKNLKSESLDIYTSIPLPIVERENLDKSVGKCENEIFTIDKSRFLLSFNENLLNENNLKIMIENLINKKENFQEQIETKISEINRYNNLKFYILENPLSKIEYSALKTDIKNNLDSIKENNKNLKNTKEKIDLLKEEKEKVIVLKEKSIKLYDNLNREYEEFKLFCKKYEVYIINKDKLEQIEKYIKNVKDKLKSDKNNLNLANATLDSLKDEKVSLESRLNNIKEKKVKYENYKDGELLNKEVEDLEARYYSLTKKISSELEELEYRLERIKIRQESDEMDLTNTQDRYNLVDEDYKNVIYNKSILDNMYKKVESYEEDKKVLNYKIIKLAKKKGKIETKIETIYKKIKEEFDKDDAKPKNEVKDKNFGEIIASEKNKKEKLYKNKKEIENNLDILKINSQSLDQFNHLKINEELSLNIKVSYLREEIGKTKRDYDNSKENEIKKYNSLKDEINIVKSESEFINDDFFKKSLIKIDEISSNPQDLMCALNQIVQSHKTVVEKLNTDIALIQKEEENVVQTMYDYIKEVHENINKIDDNSRIKINNKDVKMLNIKVENWEENKLIYKLKTKNLLENLTDSCLKKLEINENIEETISKSITTKNLYNEVVSISSIDIKLYKVEENSHKIISWEQVCKNSGGEGFLSAFVVLNSLLSYMRKDYTDLNSIWCNKEDSKVIIMDNPFAQTNAEHLLKPLMDMAKKSNTQLICFSGLKGDSIYNRFDNIYVLDTISSKLKNNISYLKGNHYKGEDVVKEIISSRFEIKEEVVSQIKLF